MDTNEALKRLFKIASTQQKVLERLAQAQGLMPAVPAQTTAQSEQMTQKLQAALFAKHPEMQTNGVFVELPQVLTPTDAGAKPVIAFKYHAGKDEGTAGKDGGTAVKAAVQQAATEVLGSNFLLQGTGEF